jgi:hypothetical protein
MPKGRLHADSRMMLLYCAVSPVRTRLNGEFNAGFNMPLFSKFSPSRNRLRLQKYGVFAADGFTRKFCFSKVNHFSS